MFANDCILGKLAVVTSWMLQVMIVLPWTNVMKVNI